MNRFWASPKAGLTARSLACLLAAVAGVPALCGQGGPPKPFLARAKAIRGADLVVLEDGRTVRLQGISLPPPVVRPEGFVQRLQAFVRAELSNREVWVVPEAHTEPGETADFVALLRQSRDGPSVNAAVLSRGLALLSCRTDTVTNMPELVAAARAAQRARAGWFARGKPRKLERFGFLNGAVLGLHYREEGRDYHRQLDELAAMGFRHVCLLFSAFLRRVDSVRLDRHHERTVRDARLIETIRYARQKGLSVMLLPIVLLLEAGDDDWRGTLKPRDEKRFFLNYDLFLSHYLDIAEATGTDIVSIGSEFGSLENRTATWERIITNARGRFGGLLTYSVNWDHVYAPKFLKQLDFVGMTAYFSLTEKRDPTPAELQAGWRRVAKELQDVLKQHGLNLPVVFTELGYASQDGINTDPWNYVMNKDQLDLEEQAQCFAAFRAVAPDMSFLGGAYFFDYFDDGGADDWSYSPRGKPALAEWKRWARLKK
jgi:hypothetical protein